MFIKKKQLKIVKISDKEFDLDYIKNKLLSNNDTIIRKIFRKRRPTRIYIPLNELCNHIMISRDILISSRNNNQDFKIVANSTIADPLFWLSWVLEWDKKINKNTSKEIKYTCAPRVNSNYDTKFSTDVVWLLWEIILYFYLK